MNGWICMDIYTYTRTLIHVSTNFHIYFNTPILSRTSAYDYTDIYFKTLHIFFTYPYIIIHILSIHYISPDIYLSIMMKGLN